MFLKRGWACSRQQPVWGAERGSFQRVRILCGTYESTSPFIEGGCATDWVEDLDGANYPLDCPGCARRCPEEIVGCAREMLRSRVVFVVGCTHRAFTFSRREQEPFFNLDGPPRRRPGN